MKSPVEQGPTPAVQMPTFIAAPLCLLPTDRA